MNLPDVNTLHAENIGDKPRHFDFSEGHGETWEYPYPSPDDWTFDECIAWLKDRGFDDIPTEPDEDDHDDIYNLRDRVEQEIRESDDYSPMMNYIYPIRLNVDEQTAQHILDDLPVVVVSINEHPGDKFSGYEPYLALSGGGMDLSWEICEAYIRLGQLPPTHFCDLPAMSGRGESERDKTIIRACLASLQRAMDWLNRDRNTLITTFQVDV